jgi:hypothetical protein
MDKFNSARNVFITSTEKMTSSDLQFYIIKNLEHFPKSARFIVMCGHHHIKKESENPAFDTVDIG